MIKMKTKIVITAAVAGVMLSACALTGCYSTGAISSTTETFDTPEGAAPVLSVAHQGRYDRLGAEGCYGCHGASEDADPFLKQASAMPDNHYKNEDRQTYEIDASHMLCTSCHVQQQKDGE